MHAVRPSRGQTLILFALSLLLLTLMVALTLSMGMKVRERTEAQTVADAAAFSNAVATARTFNNIAVLNRAQIAFAVSQAGAQSLISWSTAYMGYVEGTYSNVSKIQFIYDIYAAFCACAWTGGFCAAACKCGIKGIKDTNKINKTVNLERKRLKAAYQALDDAAATEVYRMQYTQLALYADQQYVYQNLKGDLGSEAYAKQIQNTAVPSAAPGEWTVATSAGSLSKDEVSGGPACATGSGAACDLPLTVAHAVSAAMGSRGLPFVSGRTGLIFAMPFNAQLARVMPPPDSSFVLEHSGSGWFTGKHSAIQSLPPYAMAAGADDHGFLFTLYNHIAHGGNLPCPPIMPWFANVTADLEATGVVPKHTWTGGKDAAPFVHWLIPCKALPSSCPGIWPPFIDYNILQVNREANNFGQPKNFALVQRNPAARAVPDPFNMAFNFKLTSASNGRFDNLTPATASQSALSTGIAYYHRGALILQHWNEPPNLLNPYWRATLVAADTDASGLDDAVKVLSAAGDTDGSQAVRALVNQGYKGSNDTGSHEPAPPRAPGPRGQAMVEMALGSIVFISVLAFGVYFAEVGFLSLKVQESAISALWDGTTGKMHTIPLSYDAGGAMSKAAASASARYADFNGLSSEVHPSMQLLFTRGSNLRVDCSTGGAPDFKGAILTRLAYRGNGGAKCGSEALLSAVNFPRSFLDQGGTSAFFQAKNMREQNTQLKVCGVGRPVSTSCQGRYSMMVDDWGLSSTLETLPCLMIGGGLTSCPNLPMTAAVFSVYTPLSLAVIPHAAATIMAYGMVGYSALPIGMVAAGEPDEHMFFMSAANEETNFMQVPNLLPDDEQSNTLPWGTSPGAAVTLSALPYSVSYGQRVANGSCFLGKKCRPY